MALTKNGRWDPAVLRRERVSLTPDSEEDVPRVTKRRAAELPPADRETKRRRLEPQADDVGENALLSFDRKRALSNSNGSQNPTKRLKTSPLTSKPTIEARKSGKAASKLSGQVPSEDQVLVAVKGVEAIKKTTRAKETKSKKKKSTFYASPQEYTPKELLVYPWSQRWKLNLDRRNLRDGELQFGRKPGADRIAWRVDYARLKNGKWVGADRIFFFSRDEYKGGPFSFLSNFYESDFKVPEVHATHVFHSVEQFYQYSKTLYMLIGEARDVQFGTVKISTKHLCAYVLHASTASDCAFFGRGARFLEKEDPKWWDTWTQFWYDEVADVLYRCVKAKFEQNFELRQKLLMTGDFQLIMASRGDDAFGIGFHAGDATDGNNEANWGQNLLGKTLEQVRAELRTSREQDEGMKLPGYCFGFWRFWEEILNEKRYLLLRPQDVKLPKGNQAELDTQWNRRRLENLVKQWPTIHKLEDFKLPSSLKVVLADSGGKDDNVSSTQPSDDEDTTGIAGKVSTLTMGNGKSKAADKNPAVKDLATPKGGTKKHEKEETPQQGGKKMKTTGVNASPDSQGGKEMAIRVAGLQLMRNSSPSKARESILESLKKSRFL